MPCSHCQQVGHNYVTCPSLTREQIQNIKNMKAKKKSELLKKKEEKEKARLELLERKEKEKMVEMIIHNNNMYEVVIYWGWKHREGIDNKLSMIKYISPMESCTIKCNKLHRIVVVPFLEVVDTNHIDGTHAYKNITNNQGGDDLFKVFDMNMDYYPDTIIELEVEYTPPKTELEVWKEFGLKSHFLLNQINDITGGCKHDNFESISPIIDLFQDISIPANCTEVDRERAGVPSTLTNIT